MITNKDRGKRVLIQVEHEDGTLSWENSNERVVDVLKINGVVKVQLLERGKSISESRFYKPEWVKVIDEK